MPAEVRLRERQRDGPVAQQRFEILGPRIFLGVFRSTRLLQVVRGSPCPSLSRPITDDPGRVSVDHQHDVVVGMSIGRNQPRLAPAAIFRVMFVVVPARSREVHAAHEGHTIVDHHDLLVLGSERRRLAIPHEFDARLPRPRTLHAGKMLPLECKEW
jgi:hypothetical protein